MPTFFATTPRGVAPLLVQELQDLDAIEIREGRAGVHFSGGLECAYRACLWSRLANRILYPLASFAAADTEQLYQGAQSIDWSRHLDNNLTLAVDCTLVKSTLNHSQFVTRRVKDAIVDQFRTASGRRPSVAADQPDVRLHCHIEADQATLSLDLSGDSLHRRGYRSAQGEAPLKENLAAAILLRAGWPEINAAGGALADPMCGSGTLLIEAAHMAADIAPGLLRNYFGFLAWHGHDAPLWQQLLTEARERREAGMKRLTSISGSDSDAHAIQTARANAARAGLEDSIPFTVRALENCPSAEAGKGLVVTNPPYGERLGEAATLPLLYRRLGLTLKRCYPGWQAAILTGESDFAHYLGLRAHKSHTLYNGALKCRLLHCAIGEHSVAAADIAADFSNRLRKNVKRLGRWARSKSIHCYRIYDADLPEYNLAIDIYQNDQRWVHVQEYEAPRDIDPRKAQSRLNAALAVIPMVLEVATSQCFLKQRKRQREGRQYEKRGGSGQMHAVREGDNHFWVNFTDYLDTGLFLDHRPIRHYIQTHSHQRRFLNLFGYTGTATVCAARGGASSTLTVDLSNTYLDWAQHNLELNRFTHERHEFIRSDVLQWLRDNRQRRFDLIFIDPPSFSRSKRMAGTLDVQRDHVTLIKLALALLSHEGELIFSTNLRRFKLDATAFSDYTIEDMTPSSIPEDFARHARIHQCYRFRVSGH